MKDKFKNLTIDEIAKLAISGAAVIYSVGYLLRVFKK